MHCIHPPQFLQPEQYNDEKESIFLREIETLFGKEKFRPGWDRVKDILKPLITLTEKKKIYLVAGTNGKGETIQNMASILHSQRISYGLFTSPHILSIKERFHFNGTCLSYDSLTQYTYGVKNFLCEDSWNQLSFFEFMLAIFLWTAYQLKVEVLLVEVGIGGLWDATNLLTPSVSIITSISRDHQDLLGTRYKDILLQKLGITRSNTPLFTALKHTYLRNMVKEYTNKFSIPWYDLYEAKVEIPNNFHDANFRLAKKSMESFSTSIICEPVKRKYILEFEKDRNILFTGSHNIDGLREMIFSNLKFSPNRILARFSRTGNDALVMKKILESNPFKWKLNEDLILTNADNWKEKFIEYYQNKSDKNLLITGSYYFFGDILKLFIELNNKAKFKFYTI